MHVTRYTHGGSARLCLLRVSYVLRGLLIFLDFVDFVEGLRGLEFLNFCTVLDELDDDLDSLGFCPDS